MATRRTPLRRRAQSMDQDAFRKPIYAWMFTDFNGIHLYQDYVFTAQ